MVTRKKFGATADGGGAAVGRRPSQKREEASRGRGVAMNALVARHRARPTGGGHHRAKPGRGRDERRRARGGQLAAATARNEQPRRASRAGSESARNEQRAAAEGSRGCGPEKTARRSRTTPAAPCPWRCERPFYVKTGQMYLRCVRRISEPEKCVLRLFSGVFCLCVRTV